MKKKIVTIFFVLVLSFVFVGQGELFSQVVKRKKVRIAKRDSWVILKSDSLLSKIRVEGLDQKGFDVFCKNLRTALEKAGIREKVTIKLGDPKGKLLTLGTFEPRLVATSGGSKMNRKMINPQPEPPRFITMRDKIRCKAPSGWAGVNSDIKAVKTDSIARKKKEVKTLTGRLVIEDSNGKRRIDQPISLDMLNTEPIL